MVRNKAFWHVQSMEVFFILFDQCGESCKIYGRSPPYLNRVEVKQVNLKMEMDNGFEREIS